MKFYLIVFQILFIFFSNLIFCQGDIVLKNQSIFACDNLNSTLCYLNKKYPTDFPIQIEKLWESDSIYYETQTPKLIDINNDCIPELLVSANIFGDLVILDTRTKKEITRIKTLPFLAYIGGFAVADVDNDKIPEIFLMSFSTAPDIPVEMREKLMCYNIDGSIKWVSNVNYSTSQNGIISTPALADFNHDGIPEVYIHNEIYNAKTGVRLLNCGPSNGLGINYYKRSITIAAELDGNNNSLELAAGYTIYKINLINVNNEIGNSCQKIDFILDNKRIDGYTSLADINLDGTLDVIVTVLSPNQSLIYIYTLENSIPKLLAKTVGLPLDFLKSYPLITKIGNNNYLSIIFAFSDKMAGYHFDGSMVLQEDWSIQISDIAGSTSLTSFDLNNDGFIELIFRDVSKLKIFDTSTNIPIEITTYDCISGTLQENPIVGDLDGSGQSKICVICTQLGNIGSGPLTVFGSPETLPGWTPARGIWNQYNYHVLNINDDGTVPRYMKNNATYKTGKYNNFLEQESLIDSLGNYPQKASNLTGKINCVNYNTPTNQYEVNFDLNNRADASLFATNSLPISFYNGNPEAGGKLIGIYYTADTIFSGSNLNDLKYTFSNDSLTYLYLVVNTERDSSGSFKEHHFLQLECDYTDNFYQFALSPITKTTAAICNGGSYNFYDDTISTAGIYYHIIQNKVGCDSVILALELNIEDTISITTTLATCDTYTWNGNLYSQSGTYIDSKTTAAGCDSIATLNLTINKSSIDITTATTCDTFSWLGAIYDETGIYTFATKTGAGCDSLMRLELNVIPPDSIMLPTQEICRGDSLLVLGTWYKDGTNATIKLRNQYQCDSFITFELRVIDTLKTNESLSICQGDSVRIFDEWQSGPGVFSKSYQSARGCDSLAQVQLIVNSIFVNSESQKICSGDSIFLFNEWKKAAGIYSEKYQTVNGCDSTEQVELIVEPQLVKSDSILICEGDSVFINGQSYRDEGIYQTILSSSKGCDTIYNFQLKYSPLLTKTENYSICEGDSILINGKYIYHELVEVYTIVEDNCKTEITANVTINYSPITNNSYILCPEETITINNIVISESTEINYTLQSVEGCDSTIHAKVTKLTWPEPPVVELDCEDNVYNASINAENWDITWLDSAGSPTATGSITTISESPASVKVSNDNDCERYYSLNIEDLPDLSQLPSFDNQNINNGDDIIVRVELYTTEWDVKWLPSNAVSCDTCFETIIGIDTNTTISLELKHLNGCTYIRTFEVIAEKEKINITIPNIINISSSSSNNTWSVLIPDGHKIEEIKVYDRWGSIVYNIGGIGLKPIPPINNTISWDGKWNGDYVVPGVYIYLLRFINTEGKLKVLTGDVTVIR